MKTALSILSFAACVISFLQWTDFNPMLLNEAYRTFYNANFGTILSASALLMLISSFLVCRLAKE